MSERIGVGLLGFGTVGSAVARRLVDDWEFLTARSGGATPVLRAVAMRDLRRTRDVSLPDGVRRTDEADSVIDDAGVSILIEVAGGLDPATTWIERALNAGKHVVTANKAVIATHGPRLARQAAAHEAGLWFEAAVGAGLPICTLLRHGLRADRVQRLDAVINGTTNVTLTRMQREGESLQAALAYAQRRGFAEADPRSDVDGWDAAYKLVILVWLAFSAHVDPEDVDRQGIGHVSAADLAYAARLGYSVKLVAHAARPTRGVVCRVRPTLVHHGHPLYDVDESEKAVLLRSDLADTVLLRGPGAGGASTASAVLGDVVEAVRSRRSPPPPPPVHDVPVASGDDTELCGYIRVRLEPVPDAAALVVQALEDRGVPVEDAVDAGESVDSHPELLVLTGSAPRSMHDGALQTLQTLAAVRDVAASMDRISCP